MTTAILLDALGRRNLNTANAKQRARDRTQHLEKDEYKAERQTPKFIRSKTS